MTELESTEQTKSARAAGFGVRFFAFALDNLIVGLIPRMVSDAIIDSDGLTPLSIGIAIAVELTVAFYFGISVAAWGTTIGKKIMKLRVVRSDGAPVSFPRGFARGLAYELSYLPLFLGFILVGIRSDNRALHDLICDTEVISTRAELVCGHS